MVKVINEANEKTVKIIINRKFLNQVDKIKIKSLKKGIDELKLDEEERVKELSNAFGDDYKKFYTE